MRENEYSFENDGIGSVIKQNLLKVPPNQRPYAWKGDHVKQLLTDVKEAIYDEENQYFLGTIVLVESDKNRRLIADGQQRIVTTSIVLARIRDVLLSLDEQDDADSISESFLKKYVRRQKEEEYLVQLNTMDDEFFRSVIIDVDWQQAQPSRVEGWPTSNQRLYDASSIALEFLKSEISGLSNDRAAALMNDWADFMEEQATVVAVVVPDEVGAFRMFETLNDRGLRASQADILKNYLFSRVSASELDTVHGLWNQIYAILADISDDQDEQMLKFLKHFWTLEHGLTRDRELAANIKKEIRKPKQALKFVSDAKAAAADYAAIFNSSDPKWGDYPQSVSADIKVLSQIINIEQIVPLVFAVANKFAKPEAKKAFALFISWSVRFMLGGTGRAGRLDKQYADLAMDVGTSVKTTARSLRDAIADKAPSDPAFERAVREAKVSSAVLARYYLICLEKHLYPGSGELQPSEDVSKVNLEHILPKTYRSGLSVNKLEHADLVTRLGNQTIMHSGLNRDSANLPFDQKQPFYAKSDIGLTNELAELKAFDRKTVDERQARMAAAAPKVWSLSFG